VPAEILEKPTKLDEAEFSVIRGHTYHTRRILDSIGDLGPITDWAASHHERLDGTGYPFHELDADLSLGARMMSVADVFTALTEDRPYRKGMRRQEVLATLEQMAQRRLLDGGIVALLRDNYEKVNRARIAAQKEEAEEYRKIMQLEV